MTRLESAVTRVDERIPGIDLPLLSVSQTRGVIRRSELTDNAPRAETLDVYKVCRKGDIVFNKMSIRAGALGEAHEDGLVTYHYEVMRPVSGTDARYIVYLIKSHSFTGELIRRERGIGAGGQANVRTTEVPFQVLRKIDAYIPAFTEQRQIADFLDRETKQIDNLIAEQQGLVENLTERKVAAFEHLAIVRNPERVVRLSRIATKLNRPLVPGAGIVTAFRDGQVTLRTERRTEGFTESNTGDGYQGVREGDIVFHGLDGFAGAVGVAERDGICSPVYHVFSAVAGVDTAFLADALRGMAVSGQLEVLAGNVRQRAVDFRSWSTFGELPIALPPELGQRDRHERIIRNAKVDVLISEAKGLIDLLKERRSALISAAVTGKIDVRSGVLSRG